MAILDSEYAKCAESRAELEANHPGKWVVICGDTFLEVYDSFQVAADQAAQKFGRGPCFIEEIGRDYEPRLPSSVMYGTKV